MDRDYLQDIDEAIAALVAARRLEVVQIRNNATNPDARERLVAIQATVESLRNARLHETELAGASGS